jgi:hypothetical protein
MLLIRFRGCDQQREHPESPRTSRMEKWALTDLLSAQGASGPLRICSLRAGEQPQLCHECWTT